MKVLLLSLSIITLTFSSSLFAGNGWSSSGGGEYIIDQNNPWFIGDDEEVKWCIDHGGLDKFSLNLKQSKIEIENAIQVLAKQLKSINQNTDYLLTPDGSTGHIFRRDYYSHLVHNFSYTVNCAEADIEFILGNYNNSKIQTFIEDIGVEKFKKIAGIAIRTNYLPEIKSKGFIYISADKGDIQYSGSRNTLFQSKTIWDSYENISSNTLFPEKTLEDDEYQKFYSNKKIKDYTMGLLQPVVTHEFGHILGFKHNHYNNIMNEDYPAKLIQRGIVFKSDYKRFSRILSRGLLETNIDFRLGFEFNYMFLKYKMEGIQKNSKAITDFFTNLPVDSSDSSNQKLFFIFDIYADERPNEEGHGQLQLAIYDENFKYKIIKKYDFISQPCQNPQKVESINFREEQVKNGSTSWTYDTNLQKWIESSTNSYIIPVTRELLRFDDNFYCGKIFTNSKLFKKQNFVFKLKHSYFGQHQITMTDEGGYSVTFGFYQNNIFSSPQDPLPVPDLSLRFFESLDE